MTRSNTSSLYQLKSHPNRLLKDHLFGVAGNSSRLVDELLKITGENLQLNPSILRQMAYVTGVAHDIGKATRYFQDYLPPKNIRPRELMLKSHSMLSALYGSFAARQLFSDREYGALFPPYVSLAIQAHHGALVSPTVAAVKNRERRGDIAHQISMVERRNELDSILQQAGLPSFSDFASQAESEIRELLRNQSVWSWDTDKFFDKGLTPFFLLNLLFSILVDSDRMDAAGLTFPRRRETSSDRTTEFVKKLSDESRTYKNANSNVADGRDQLFKILSRKATKVSLDQHIFSLTAPTGYGKTLAGLHFALKLKERVSENGFFPRIVYVGPYLSILDQNFERIAKGLGVSPTQSSVLLLHHHLAEMQYETSDLSRETFSALDSELLIEGWNAEIIVTSFIQFFYAIVGSRSSQLRRLHNLAGSIVVLDEVQTLKHEYWPFVRETLKFMANELRMYVVLMTATQPLIFGIDEVSELADELPKEAWKPRVTFRSNVDKDITLEEFVENVNRLEEESRNKSILIVMNTIATSARVFNELRTSREKYYLSANVVPAQRKERIERISKDLRQGAHPVVVSTQVVEAGVDLDFDMVVRDMGPVDSIIQVAGRCNRNGLRKPEDSEVYVYSVVDEGGRHYSNRIYGNYLVSKSRDVLRASEASDPQHLAEEYYCAVQKGSSDVESEELLEWLRKLDYERLQRFKLIEDQSDSSLYVEIDENTSRIWERYVRILESKSSGLERKEEFLRMRGDFYNYVINVRAGETSGLKEINGFYHISLPKISSFYDENTGFIHVNQSRSIKQEARIY